MKQSIYPFRRKFILIFFASLSVLLVWRAAFLHIVDKDFLQDHGDARSLRVVSIPAHRGMITDRNNEPLAISTPVDSIWAIPRQVLEHPEDIPVLANLLDMSTEHLLEMLNDRIDRQFVYLKRHISPDLTNKISSLEIFGVHLQQEC